MSSKIKIKFIVKKWAAISLSILLPLLLSSCKKFIEVGTPTTSLVTESVFEKNNTATAAQLSIYAQMQSFLYNLDQATGLSSDELKNYTSNLSATDIYKNALNAANDADKISVWKPAYNLIYQANVILETLPNSPGVTTVVKQQLTGESKFLRAFFYFYLVNLYGDVPLILSTDYTTNSKLTRTSTIQVYQQIVADLLDAQNLLNTNYVDATDTIATPDKIRPNKWASTALLARVYLYTGEWAKAEALASSIISNTTFSLQADLTTVFLKNSAEAIWQLQPNSNNKYTAEGSGFILTKTPIGSSLSYASTISDQLLDTFESGDKRKNKWIADSIFSSVNFYFPNKYKATTTSTSLTEYSMVLRLAEQYLIRAEARARQGNNLQGAIDDLNKIRNRAGLGNYAGVSDQPSVLAAIMHERQVELLTEGHRWLDLKRTGTVDAVMSTITPQKGSQWNSYQQWYPIPVTDIQNSVGIITQNAGY